VITADNLAAAVDAESAHKLGSAVDRIKHCLDKYRRAGLAAAGVNPDYPVAFAGGSHRVSISNCA
jgi:hypothetical protein